MSQDFFGQNLRGRSFSGQNLEEANFSYADIRGTDFSNANLTRTNFSHAKAGLKSVWIVTLVIISFIVIIITGFVSGTSGIVASNALSNEFITKYTLVPSVGIISIIVVFFLCTIYYGVTVAIVNLVWILPIAWILAWVGARDKAADWTLALALVFGWSGALAWCGAFAEVCVGEFAWIWTLTGVLAWVLSGAIADKLTHISIWSWVVIAIAAWALTLIGSYIAKKGFAGDPKFSFVRSITIVFGAIQGTNFQGANLTDANFTKAILTSTNLRNATITRTCWFNAQKLNRAWVGDSYLKYPKVRNLVVKGVGENQNFDDLPLQGLNLQGANLADASFIRTNLNQANLQDTNLSRAKLVQTQLDGTDLTGATLTGATIEDWGITSHTKLYGVRCEYVFMRCPSKEDLNPHRKPDNWEEKFSDGDFADFIKPIVDTLDLYHNQGVDPRAIAVAFKELAENNPDAELEIVAIERRGEDKILLRAKTAATANKSDLSQEYFINYHQLKALAEQDFKALIANQKLQIRRLENMITTALERPSFYAENYHNQGDTIMSEGSKKQSNFNLQGAQFAGGLVNADSVKAHQIGGDITNYNQVAQAETNSSTVKTILILASNPKNTSALRLDEEVREIDAGLQRAKKRELFDLKQRWAVRVQEVYQSLLDFKPQIVHFSGHGTGDDGLVLEDETGQVRLVDTEALAKLFELFANTIECVVLNACYSEVQAQAIVKYIPYVIGMNKEVGDKAAIKFATGFYNALGAGESVEFAYKLGCSVIQLDGIPENLMPVLNIY
jgi:uncharacterized protein YjbI with pentapeptide repeats